MSSALESLTVFPSGPFGYLLKSTAVIPCGCIKIRHQKADVGNPKDLLAGNLWKPAADYPGEPLQILPRAKSYSLSILSYVLSQWNHKREID